MNLTPSSRPAQLADGRQSPPQLIEARIRRGVPSNELRLVELNWSPVREQLARLAQLEHGHWDWRNKELPTERGELSIVGVECEAQMQGMMAIGTEPRSGKLSTEPLVYIDYLEVAPWNQRCPAWPRRFLGTGAVLLAEAIILGIECGFAGRVGLHSLPQAEKFYRGCEMSDLGPDPEYHSLRYFEYTSERANAWLFARNAP